MRVLQIGSDRSKRGDLVAGSAGSVRQETYARAIGYIDDISFTLSSDGFTARRAGELAVYPTNSVSRLLYGVDAFFLAKRLPRSDVVSAQDPFEAGLIAWLIARARGAPLYVQVHTDLFSPVFTRRHWPLNHLRLMLARFVLHRASRVRVVSEHIKRQIEQQLHIEAPISVLPMFIDVQKFAHAKPSSELVQCFAPFDKKALVVSRLEEEKNIALAISSFAQATSSKDCLIIVGEGSEKTALMRLVQERGIADRVFFEGEQDPTSYYALADVVLFTSYYDGYGLVIIEALAAGKPVVSTDVGIAREAGAIIASPATFAAALTEWFKNGPPEMRLKKYLYPDLETYARVYAEDIAAALSGL